jgi:CDP-glucose 4,6-dehydratase
MEDMVTNSTFWQDRPVLVTGASGLVGGWLTKRLLAHQAEVVCVVRDWVPDSVLLREKGLKKVRLVRGDIRNMAFLERVMGEYEINTTIHLAAQTIVSIANRNPISTFETNITGTWNILEAARRSPKVEQIVIASSDKAYGECETLPYDESTPLAGTHPYDVSKSCADLIARTYAVTYGSPVAITRCGNFYGGGDLNWNRIIPGTIRSIVRGKRPIIRSDGNYTRDYFFVEDGAAAYMHLAEKLAEIPNLKGEGFNFSNETPLSVLQITEMILKAMGSNLQPIIRNEVTNEIRHQYLNAEKSRSRLNWKPIYSIQQGLDRTIAWYREFFRNA